MITNPWYSRLNGMWPKFMPKMPVISVSGSRITEKIVRMRRMSFCLCAMTDSLVVSSASTTSL